MLPRSPPVPILAQYFAAADVLRVFFDRQLIPGFSAAANWGGCILLPGNTIVLGSAPGAIINNRVDVPCIRAGPCINPNTCGYNAAPPDVFNHDGVPAAAFSLFPVTVLP